MAGSAPRPAGTAPGDAALAILGVRCGEPVRWQAPGGGRWETGTITRRERDGSIGVVDGRGGARSLSLDRVHVARRGPRGGAGWEPLLIRAGRAEQLCLLPLA